MLNETRVNLKHLLEDIRDSYSTPLEEVILIELIANALDSKSSRIDFTVNAEGRFLRCVDNGTGMKRQQLKEYHNIAASAKVRGAGIGFAGVGAKLALLVADRVITESKGGYGSRAATEWRLTNPYRAPWKFIPSSDAVKSPRGTSVTMHFVDDQPHLLNNKFVVGAITKHFYPLLHNWLHQEILRFVYRHGIEMTVNGELVALNDSELRVDHGFKVFLGKSKKPVGAGLLRKNVLEQGWLARWAGRSSEEPQVSSGLAISTYGKIIKSGWEWLGILPKHADCLSGVVEIPMCSELLTTNKNDFLSDAAHLKRYYQMRKAVQQAVVPVLRVLGEYASDLASEQLTTDMKPLTRRIETALESVSDTFPELIPLLGTRRSHGMVRARGNVQKDDREEEKIVSAAPEPQRSDKKERAHGGNDSGRAKKPGLQLTLEELPDAPDLLGRMIEETIAVNTLHPAWKKAMETGQEEYHVVVVVGLALADYLAPEKHPQEFLSLLLSSWSKVEMGQRKLL